MFRRIYVLSGISIFAVVLSHGISFGLWALYAWTGQYQYLLPENFDPFRTLQWFILIFGKQLLSFCVPAFFLITGFFVFYAIDKRSGNIRWETIKNRLIRLFYPFVIWTIIAISLNIVLGTITQPIDFILPFFGINGYWFIPTIIVFYLMAQWVIILAQKNWKYLLICSGLLQILLIVLRYIWFDKINISLVNYILSDNFDVLFINYIFYFPLGVVIGMNSIAFKNWLHQYRTIILISCVFLIVFGLYVSGWTKAYVNFTGSWNNFLLQTITHLYSLAFILTFLAFDNVKIPLFNWFSKLGSQSYGIYLTHYFFMTFFSKLIYHFFPSLLYYQLLFTLLIIAIGLYGSLSSMCIVRKLPVGRVHAYLFG